MAWPQLVKRTVTCPSCGSSITVEAIHEAHRRVHGSRDRIYASFTWVDCPTCGAEWEDRETALHVPGHAA